jgi:hypothetical protein
MTFYRLFPRRAALPSAFNQSGLRRQRAERTKKLGIAKL